MSRPRRTTAQVSIGGVRVGGGAPIVVQSMTNTDTADVEGTARQVQALARAGSELVRITVNTSEAAAAVAPIRASLERAGVQVPLIGDFTSMATSSCASTPTVLRRSPSTASTPGMSAAERNAIRSSPK